MSSRLKRLFVGGSAGNEQLTLTVAALLIVLLAVEGATILLPVSNPGALLYFGDAHAAQGDGELNGNALETSMDVELKIDIIHGRDVPGPRLHQREDQQLGAAFLQFAVEHSRSLMLHSDILFRNMILSRGQRAAGIHGAGNSGSH